MLMKRVLGRLLLVTTSFVGLFIIGGVVSANPYGRGEYGLCNYGDACTISVATLGTVSLSLDPTPSGVFTIDKDQVTVVSNSVDGYTLTLESASGTENSLVGTVDELTAVSGTTASPTTLTGNEWGFRIDSYDGFGAGPTSAITSQSSSSLTFAGVPLNGSPTTIKTTSSATAGDNTDVWYGARADFGVAPDTYSQTVVYTATTL